MDTRLGIHVAWVVLVAMVIPLPAQVTGRLTGSVLDPSGSTIPSALVSIMMPGSTEPLLNTITTSDGLFTLAGVRPDY